MAFVYRSSSRDKFLDMNPIPLGPGQYNPEISKTEGRLKHQKGMKFSKIIKNSHSPQIIPFNTTSQRSQIIKFDNYQPGPGAYTLTERKKNNNNYSSFSTEREIADILSMNNQNSEFKGFLSSEKRFNTDKRNITDENISPGPGSYNLILHFSPKNNKTKNKFLKEKYTPNKGKIYTLPGKSEQKITSIPDKTKGKFKIIKGILTEIKNNKNDSETKRTIGPGTYELFPKWEGTSIMWGKGFKKEEKSKLNESKIQKELEQNSTMFNTENYSEKMHNFNMSTVSSTFNNNNSKSKNTSSQLTKTMNINTNNSSINKIKNLNLNGWNTATNLNYKNNSQLYQINSKPQIEGLIRNKIFHNFFENKQKHHTETLSKQNYKNNLILDMEYPTPPGPGFYDQNIIPKHTNFSYTAQNFGSNSPKFNSIKTENDILGPGTYFKEKNKYEPKIKNLLHIKFPEKQNMKNEKSVYVSNLIKKNKEYQPGPGEYNIEGELIKKEISNIKSFGSNVERFHGKEITTPKKQKKNSSDDNNNIKVYINQYKIEEDIKSIHLNKKIKYLTKLEKNKKKEKLRRQPYVYKPIPCVGTYSPEITKSIYYQVFSKINPYRNTVAPFNMINTRFSQVKNPRLEKKETPGPADYEVLPAFKALNLDKRKYNIFGQNEQRKSVIKDPVVPGPGLYNLNRQDEWNKKSYNVLFINK